jgi:archaellum biogenesis protein FlaJ (TadC family)
MSFPHTFGFNQMTGREHAYEGCATAVTVLAGFWVSVMVHMAFVVDEVALGALLLSLAICHFTIYLHSYCLWSVQSVGCSIK